MNVINVDGDDITYRYVYKIPPNEEDINFDNIMSTRLAVFKLEDVCKLVDVGDLSKVIPEYLKFISSFWFDDILEYYNSDQARKGIELLRSLAATLEK